MTPEEEELTNTAYRVACSYLLHERSNQTQLAIAFTTLCQERHIEFHDSAIESFMDCKNDICFSAKKILQQEQEMSIEITPLTSEVLERYNIVVHRTPSSVTIKLVEKNLISRPEEGIILRI